jgi:aminopeptidase N
MPWRSGHFLVSAGQPQLSGSSKTRRSYRTSGLRARASETRFPISGPRDGSSDYSLIDAKGGWILQMVRDQLGDAKFWKAVQHYTRKFTFQNATTSDFVEAISESTGQDLEWLFDQYVYRPGHPSFDVAWEYDAAEHTVHVAVKQIEGGSTEPYHLPVEFEVLGDSLPRTFRAWVDNSKQNREV